MVLTDQLPFKIFLYDRIFDREFGQDIKRGERVCKRHTNLGHKDLLV